MLYRGPTFICYLLGANEIYNEDQCFVRADSAWCATLAIGKFRRNVQKAAAADLHAQQALIPALDDHSDAERLRGQAIFEKVSGHVKREPAQSSRLLQSWIHSDGS